MDVVDPNWIPGGSCDYSTLVDEVTTVVDHRSVVITTFRIGTDSTGYDNRYRIKFSALDGDTISLTESEFSTLARAIPRVASQAAHKPQ